MFDNLGDLNFDGRVTVVLTYCMVTLSIVSRLMARHLRSDRITLQRQVGSVVICIKSVVQIYSFATNGLNVPCKEGIDGTAAFSCGAINLLGESCKIFLVNLSTP